MGAFHHTITLPPTDNMLVRHTSRGHYPTAKYVAWLRLEAPLLALALRKAGIKKPDEAHWWMVSGWLSLPSRRTDGPNYLKATLDLLSGAQVVGGRVKRLGALWDDDRRVRVVNWNVRTIGLKPGGIALTVGTVPPPEVVK